jgi:hypothetical protein
MVHLLFDGDGAGKLSPDGKWALRFLTPPQLVLLRPAQVIQDIGTW